jgi:hypothetical protein
VVVGAGLGVVVVFVAVLCGVVVVLVVVVLAASLAVDVVLVELLPQPATAMAATTAQSNGVFRRITARLTTTSPESFGGGQPILRRPPRRPSR